MRKFSQRLGLIKPRSAIQRGIMDDRLRNRLWSLVDKVFWSSSGRYLSRDTKTRWLFWEIQEKFFGKPIDELNDNTLQSVRFIREWAYSASWNEFYDFIQFLADFSNLNDTGEPFSQCRRLGEVFISMANDILEAEKSAYRFVGSELCEVTDEQEIVAIEEAIAPKGQFDGATKHVQNALSLYANRDRPDYRNSIKESISAIESAFSSINGERSRNLSSALALAEKKGFKLHPALKNGISNIYGWTSDEEGVRHAFFENEGDIGERQAKLMLVLCSALLNFLTTESKP